MKNCEYREKWSDLPCGKPAFAYRTLRDRRIPVCLEHVRKMVGLT